ncbi:CCA tRNA nucleotidyltransferase [Rhodococcoides fascians]|uniref:CCA tRNA nucleotidyltransferase n=1 Tax=Rhodococcoides fascians TaxID=1828 RepID=UPI001D7D145C|nr:CCA tRNA nucleotidyltransferase [Rhodococcus fascians]CAH0190710.1 CCA-adding enzyme [Rhodococcus fascians]
MKHAPTEEITSEVRSVVGDVYLVGGSVRDSLLGRQAKDYDFCTALEPDQIEERVKEAGKHAYAIGKRFGTIGFKCLGEYVEVTTFRTERYSGQSRKPEVQFVADINQDLGRRDFTINAIAQRGGRLIDPYRGVADLRERTIRPVGNGTERVKEDPLRMLRAARFAAQLGFDVDPGFIVTMRKHSHRIMQVSRERWIAEMDKLLMSADPVKGLDVLAESQLLKFILPELWIQVGYDQHSPYHELTLWEHTTSTVALAPHDLDLRWAVLLHDVGKPFVRTEKNEHQSNYVMHDVVGPYIAEGITARLKFSNSRRDTIVGTIRHHLEESSPLRMADNGSKTKLPLGDAV